MWDRTTVRENRSMIDLDIMTVRDLITALAEAENAA
jgi:hypothetical protein